jgi:hypothetical protein
MYDMARAKQLLADKAMRRQQQQAVTGREAGCGMHAKQPLGDKAKRQHQKRQPLQLPQQQPAASMCMPAVSPARAEHAPAMRNAASGGSGSSCSITLAVRPGQSSVGVSVKGVDQLGQMRTVWLQ